MTVKDKLIELLEQNRGEYLSGEAIAARLQVSRAAVWKAMEALRQQGHQIEAAPHSGYRLAERSDRLSRAGIALALPEKWKSIEIEVHASLSSTNTRAKELAVQGAPEGTLVVAEEQSQGRGRFGKRFYSPPDGGIYMSLLLRPQAPWQQTTPLTAAAAVAVCRTVERVCGQRPQIKWVNDVFCRGRKICGILCEAVSDFESGMVEAVVVGIGVNVRTQAFPEEIRDIAGSLELESVPRARLIGLLVGEVLTLAENLCAPALMQEYRARSLVLGQRIAYEKNGRMYQGVAADILDNGNLLVRLDNGESDLLQSGEISLGSGRLCC